MVQKVIFARDQGGRKPLNSLFTHQDQGPPGLEYTKRADVLAEVLCDENFQRKQFKIHSCGT